MKASVAPPHGRRADEPPLSTPERIQTAAIELFGRYGFGGTSVRGIARAAGVDPALVIRHFGSKEALFLQTVPPYGAFDDVVDGPLDSFGRRTVEFILDRRDDSRLAVYIEVLRASDSDAIRQRMGEIMDASFSKLKDQLSGPDPLLRTRLIAAQVTGLLIAMSVAPGGLRTHDRRDIVTLYGSAIQALVTPA